MDIKLEQKNETEALIKIKLKESDYQSKVEEKVKDYRKKANVKGFRPGKVPTSYIKKLYGKSILVNEINHIISHKLNDYIKENKLKILGDPLPNAEKAQKIDWDNQKDFDFEYEIGLASDFDLKLDKKLKVNHYEIEVDAKSIDDTLDNLKQQFGTMTNPEVSADDDTLYGELANESDFSSNVTIDLTDVEKKQRKQFIKVKKDDSIVFDIDKVIKDLHAKSHVLNTTEDEAKELTGEFSFKVLNINRKEAAVLNQEFFDKVFGKDAVKTEGEFRSKISETIGKNYERETDHFLHQEIQDKLIEKAKMVLPNEFLKKWLLTINEGKVTKEDIEKEFDLYTKDLKWNLIQNKIGEESEVKVENEDILTATKNMIREQFAASGMGGQMDDNLDMFADNYLKGEDGQNYMKVYNQVRGAKIMELVKEKISLTKKKVDVEKFKKLVSN